VHENIYWQKTFLYTVALVDAVSSPDFSFLFFFSCCDPALAAHDIRFAQQETAALSIRREQDDI